MSTPYRIFYAGEWHPVEHMFRGEDRVLHPERATSAVVRLGKDEWLAIAVGPGDLFTDWFPLRPPASAWERVD